MNARRLRSDDGVTLVEILVAVSILGVALVTLMGGMWTAVVASDVHRKQATSGVAVRSYAEAVKAVTYANCATTSAFTPAAAGFSAPSGFTASATSVEYWHVDGSDPNTGSFNGTCTTDEGLQRVTIQVVAADGRASESVQVLKRKP